MKTRILSVLLVFLLVMSFATPAVSAEPSHVYYELHNLCRCNADEDLGQIPFLTFGIGYSSRVIDPQTDEWEIFIHAGGETKSLTITPDTPTETIITLRDFVNYVDECKEESDPIGRKLLAGAGAAGYSIVKAVEVLRKMDVKEIAKLFGALAISFEEFSSLVTHFSNAKNAQKNAETLFGVLYD